MRKFLDELHDKVGLWTRLLYRHVYLINGADAFKGVAR